MAIEGWMGVTECHCDIFLPIQNVLGMYKNDLRLLGHFGGDICYALGYLGIDLGHR